MRPVVTVTLNPAIDETVWIDELVPGTTHRTADARSSIGGKGVNVARTVAGLGHPAFGLGIAGDDRAAAIERHLASLGVPSRFVAVPGETRVNLKLIERSSGRLTEINGAGPLVGRELLEALESELLAAVERMHAAVVVFAGSLPVGVPASIYADWTRRLAGLTPAVPVIVDASDDALALAVTARPLVVKPNRVEAERLLGEAIRSPAEACAAALRIAEHGPRGVLLSLGRDGAVGAWDGNAQHLEARSIESVDGLQTTVGAGDAMVARLAVEIARSREPNELSAEEFLGIARLAVEQASSHITGGADHHLAARAQPDGSNGRRPPAEAVLAARAPGRETGR